MSDSELETHDLKSPENDDLIDSFNPYFLHHLDHPGITFVFKVHTCDSYGTWSQAMRMNLSAKNKA
ncbi:hypothetical protein Dsin_005514, partial [Dipteronia sinensis]